MARSFFGILRVLPLALVLGAGCSTTGSLEAQLTGDAADAYARGKDHFAKGQYDQALDAFTTARSMRWAPVIDGMIARTLDAQENPYRSCPYWRSLRDGDELAAMVADGVEGAETLEKEATRRTAECWSKGLGLPVPLRGPVDAPVTLLVFSDFQCPFCQRLTPTLEKVLSTYPDDVRIAFMHNPLPFHKQALPAAEFAVAAQLQGRFWETHDVLFANYRKLREETWSAWAETADLDWKQLDEDRQSPGAKAYVKRQMAVARALEARGTPTTFINGVKLPGAQPFSKFQEAIDAALVDARAEEKRGTPRAALHDLLSRRNNENYAKILIDGVDPESITPKASNDRTPKEDRTVWKVPVRPSDPMAGPADALVTVVWFNDLQCPYCARANGTIAQVRETYGDKVRIVGKQNPLAFHKQARGAALATLAAHEQGRFWEMHDRLMANQRDLTRDRYMTEARALGLDMVKFQRALEDRDGHLGQIIDADQALAAQVKARGTPNFFINGRNLRGAQPFDRFKAVIDQELAAAEKRVAAGTSKASLYEIIIANGKEFDPLEGPAVTFSGDRPSVGSAKARVTVTIFTDFQCPFCVRLDQQVREVQKRLGRDTLRVVYRQFPLNFHKEAEPAARAALAAWRQNKFEAMRDKLFDNQRDLANADWTAWAKALGLNVSRFQRDMNAEATTAIITEDKSLGPKVGVRGTPTVFINGFLWQRTGEGVDALETLIRSRFLK